MAGTPFDAAMQGYAFGNQLYMDRAKRKAGNAFAQGDYSGAANALAGQGAIDQAAAVTQYGQQQQDRTHTLEQQDKAERAKWMLQAAEALRDHVPVEKRAQEYQTHIAPVLRSMNIPDEALSQVTDFSDSALDSFISTLGGTPKTPKGSWKEVRAADGSSTFKWMPDDPFAQPPQQPTQAAPQAPAAQPAAAAQSDAPLDFNTYLDRTLQIESAGDPNAKNGSSTGLFQFHPDTFAGLGFTDINDPGQQRAAALKLAQQNAAKLSSAGLPADPASLYVMHQQGTAGGMALLKSPDQNAIAALTPVYGNAHKARQAILNNGGSENMTAGQFVDMWRQKFGSAPAAQPYQVASNADVPPPAGAQSETPATGPSYPTMPGSAADPTKTLQRQKLELDVAKLKREADLGGDGNPGEISATDPESSSLLAQTGLSMPAFLAITGQASKLPRDAATRNAAFKQAEQFANSRGVDVSTMASQYDAYNKTLQANVMRNNQTNILEQELDGTISVLQPLADQAGLGGLRVGNVVKLFAGKEVNDPTVQQYRQQLLMLQSELAGMNAAARGNIDQAGNVKTDQSDMEDAARVIVNGLNSKGAGGLAAAIHSTTSKNRAVLEKNIDASRKAIWDLFGVGAHYKPKSAAATHSVAGASKGLTPAQLKAVARFKGSTAPGGSAQNPIVTRTEADYARLKSGQHYVFTDGRVMVKP